MTITCRVLDVASGGYYAWLRRRQPGQLPGPREAANQQLSEQIQAVYTAAAEAPMLSTHSCRVASCRMGDCYDNAMMESFFSTLKSECATEPYPSPGEARLAIFE